jgi:hypothetical protein
MPVMHACAHSTTLHQVGPHLAATYFFEVAKAADVCSTLRIHNQCECCTSAEFARCHPIFFYKMAHDKVFGTHCNITSARIHYVPSLLRSFRLYRVSCHRSAVAAAAAAAAASAVCLVSTKSWTEVIFTLFPEDLSVKMNIDSLENDAPPGPSP